MASESFIHAWLGSVQVVFRCAPGFGTYRSQRSITAVYFKCLLTQGFVLRRLFTSKFEEDGNEHKRLHSA